MSFDLSESPMSAPGHLRKVSAQQSSFHIHCLNSGGYFVAHDLAYILHMILRPSKI